MPTHRRSRSLIYALLLALCVVPIIAIFAALPWLDRQPDELVFLLSGIAATLVLASGLALDILHDTHLDEWERSAQRFSIKYGWGAASALIALLINLPPIHDLIVQGAAVWGGVPNPDRRLVLTTFTFGFMAVVVTQAVFMALMGIGWVCWKSRAAREPS